MSAEKNGIALAVVAVLIASVALIVALSQPEPVKPEPRNRLVEFCLEYPDAAACP